MISLLRFGRSDKTRTCDLMNPNHLRYQTALHSDMAAVDRIELSKPSRSSESKSEVLPLNYTAIYMEQFLFKVKLVAFKISFLHHITLLVMLSNLFLLYDIAFLI